MMVWWNSLTQATHFFYVVASFFSVFFIWQLISVFIGGMGDEADGDLDAANDGTYDDFEDGAQQDAYETDVAFKLLSIRSVIAFFTLFSWAGALYLTNGKTLAWSMTVGCIWGLAGMVSVAGIFYLMKRLQESGNSTLASCVGTTGTVYLNIPANGEGEVKVIVSGVQTHVRARTASGEPLLAGATIRVLRCLNQRTIEVEKD
jgi:hypothetical protein